MGNKEECLSADMENRKLEAIMFIKDLYPDFYDWEYEVAAEMGDINCFKCYDKFHFNGNTLHYTFVIRVFEYLSGQMRLKNFLCRS